MICEFETVSKLAHEILDKTGLWQYLAVYRCVCSVRLTQPLARLYMIPFCVKQGRNIRLHSSDV